MKFFAFAIVALLLCISVSPACSTGTAPAAGSVDGSAGATGAGGKTGSGGAVESGGSFGSGGATKSGGASGSNDAGPGAGCLPNPSAICSAITAGFTCTGGASPQGSSSCLLVYNSVSGEDVSCCTLGPGSSSCSIDPTVSCASPARGYSCTGSDTPAQGGSLICDKGTSAGSKTNFCCREYQSASCRLDVQVLGCDGVYPFRCSGSLSPSSADPGLQCSGRLFVDGTTGYCCTSQS
jgi:hypothetical protein